MTVKWSRRVTHPEYDRAAGRPIVGFLERVFDYSELVEMRGRWWNGKWGRMARRDIWLMYDGNRWLVRGREGGEEGREVNYQFDQEWAARAMVDRMMKASAGSWRDLTKLVRRESDRRQVD